MNQYKDTPLTLNALRTPKKRQIDTKSKITFHDVIKSILIAFFMVGLLLLISSYRQAYPKNSLPSIATMNNNSITTKHIAVKPSRHSLAIFVPKINPTTNRTIATGAKRHIYVLSKTIESVTIYDGLIDLIQYRQGNKSSSLYAVVNTRCPMLSASATKLTNHIGVANHG